jgi:hypothetical protein
MKNKSYLDCDLRRNSLARQELFDIIPLRREPANSSKLHRCYDNERCQWRALPHQLFW